MPINRNALIRYRTIDRCLQNRRRKWTIEDLMEACDQALDEAGVYGKAISLRTIRLDLQAMRGAALGYNAPIVVKDKKYYTYEDPDFSIANSPLSGQDLEILQEVSQLLQQFKGFHHFREVSEMVQRLEDKIYSEQNKVDPVIDFEKNELLTGLNWLEPLYKHIVNKEVLAIEYQSFKARGKSVIWLHPYLLKEYRNRWFLFGCHNKSKNIMALALDRIKGFRVCKSAVYYKDQWFDPKTYFDPIVGVTRGRDEKPIEIQFRADYNNSPYIITKPIHKTQQLLYQKSGWSYFSIHVIPNRELDREFLGFGVGLELLRPVRGLTAKVMEVDTGKN
ncbi:MAG: WYL domain-containing protein [Chitinophagaceae bacterium]|uniref:helix-turn-helix transcriptional regulator n=1 Tax=unclassified Paraflavitalea TaxID=2798305 RepID=UPI003D347CB9|nr:WYL domain-containing protein [Chitinophagaceae bacterium]